MKLLFDENLPARLVHDLGDAFPDSVTVLPYDAAVARMFGQIRAGLEAEGTRIDDC